MEDFKQLLTLQKPLRIRIDLTEDFPMFILNDSGGTVKKSNKVLLKDVVFFEDLPSLVDQIDLVMSKSVSILQTHARILIGNDYHWFLFSCELRKDKFSLKILHLSGIIFDVSHYFETAADDPVIMDYRNKNIERVISINSSNTSLSDILDLEYLSNIQMPFRYIDDVYSAIFNEKDELICTPASGEKGFNINSFKFFKKFDIRINHNIAGYWIISSNKEGVIESNTPLLEVLAMSVSKIVNAYVVLFNEMTNSERANKMLGKNIEQQILINSIYSIVLEKKRSDEALRAVIKLVGEYMNFERITIFSDNPQNGELVLQQEWVSSENFSLGNKTYSYDDIPVIIKQLEYTDVYYPMKTRHEMQAYGVKSFVVANLNGDGKRFGFIFFEIISEERTQTSQESKILRSISQIIATLLIQYQMDIKLLQTTEQLRHLAFHDTILDVPNRAQLDKDLSLQLSAGVCGTAIAVKVTNMRVFNELFGHAYTDNMLKSVTSFIKNLPAENLSVYRFSGNMLIILLIECDGIHAKNLAEELLLRFKSPWEQENNHHFLEAGLGIALFPDNGTTCEEIYRAASLSVYRAIEYGQNSYAFYSKEFEKSIGVDYFYTHKLKSAINSNMSGFHLKYQPIIDVSSGKLSMCEVFLNWNDGENTLPPRKLIQLSENVGFDTILDSWVIEKACGFCKKIQNQIFPDFAVSVNITSRELRSSSIISIVENALEISGLNPKYLSIEIPEHILASQIGNIIPIVSRLKKIGINIVIDSFGRDFVASNLLKYSYVDLVKSDFSLFTNVHDRFDEILVDTVINLSKTVRYGICVKRIEDIEQLEMVKKYGINFIQGYYYSKPLYEDDIVKYIIEKNNLEIIL